MITLGFWKFSESLTNVIGAFSLTAQQFLNTHPHTNTNSFSAKQLKITTTPPAECSRFGRQNGRREWKSLAMWSVFGAVLVHLLCATKSFARGWYERFTSQQPFRHALEIDRAHHTPGTHTHIHSHEHWHIYTGIASHLCTGEFTQMTDELK